MARSPVYVAVGGIGGDVGVWLCDRLPLAPHLTGPGVDCSYPGGFPLCRAFGIAGVVGDKGAVAGRGRDARCISLAGVAGGGLADLDVGSLVVMDGGKMVGMLTFREVLLALKGKATTTENLMVGDVMVANPVTAFPDMEANELRRLMIEKHSRYLPVVEGETLLGVISFLDVAKAVLEEQSFENKMLKSYIKDWPNDQQA